MYALAFTPVQALLGGAVLAATVVGRMKLSGRITGIAGAVKGAALEPFRPSSRGQMALVVGILASGRAAAALTPELLEIVPTASLARVLAAGACVCFGTAMSNGCTSGHGLCGIGRLSLRSILATCTFMATGVAASLLSGTAGALGMSTAQGLSMPSKGFYALAAAALAVTTAVPLVAGAIAKGTPSAATKAVMNDVADGAFGATFGAGLVLSGMPNPSKVIGFLSPLTPHFDASLMFVMGGALAIITPAFAIIMRNQRAGRACSGSTCGGAYEVKFGPTAGDNGDVSARLLAGAAVFGVGWGLLGACPGPALVQAAASPTAQAGLFWAAFVSGQYVNEAVGGGRDAVGAGRNLKRQ